MLEWFLKLQVGGKRQNPRNDLKTSLKSLNRVLNYHLLPFDGVLKFEKLENKL